MVTLSENNTLKALDFIVQKYVVSSSASTLQTYIALVRANIVGIGSFPVGIIPIENDPNAQNHPTINQVVSNIHNDYDVLVGFFATLE